MKYRFRSLIASFLALLLLCVPLSPVLAKENAFSSKQTGGASAASSSESTPAPTPAPTDSPYIGTVVITKKGYQSARQSPSDNTTVFRVHYGERYLCTADTGNGWYEIVLPTWDTAYVSSNSENTALQRGVVDEPTLSMAFTVFTIKALKKLDVYSQPKTSAQSRRVSGDGSTETTFYYSKGTELVAFGKTTRDNREWYLFLANNNGVNEPAWALAADCEVLSGDPNENIIPAWWYD